MFKISSNTFLDNGICKYEDGCGNSVFMKRKGEGFVAKLRFANENIKTQPITYDPSKRDDSDGAFLHVDFLDGKDNHSDEFNSVVAGFAQIVQRWICMLSDISMFSSDNNLIKSANPEMTDNDIWFHKISQLKQYEELQGMLDAVFR